MTSHLLEALGCFSLLLGLSVVFFDFCRLSFPRESSNSSEFSVFEGYLIMTGYLIID